MYKNCLVKTGIILLFFISYLLMYMTFASGYVEEDLLVSMGFSGGWSGTLCPRNSSTIDVHVTDKETNTPVLGAKIKISSNPELGITIQPDSGITDNHGLFISRVLASQTGTYSLIGRAEKEGYIEGIGSMVVDVENECGGVGWGIAFPKYHIDSDPDSISTDKTSALLVRVTQGPYENGEPVSEANVWLSSSPGGIINPNFGKTDYSGLFRSAFTASSGGLYKIVARGEKELSYEDAIVIEVSNHSQAIEANPIQPPTAVESDKRSEPGLLSNPAVVGALIAAIASIIVGYWQSHARKK